MSYSKTIYVHDVGQVVLKKRKRVRRLTLSLEPDAELKVTVPYWLSFRAAENMLVKEKKWVHRYLDRMAKVFERQRSAMREEGITGAPIDLSAAVRELSKRLYELARKYRYAYNKVRVRKLKSCWGSCSGKNNISLNAKLMKLPQRLKDYVILHELVHTKIKNHSKEFWQELNVHLEEPKKLDNELRRYYPCSL